MKEQIREWLKSLFFIITPSKYKEWYFKRHNNLNNWKISQLEPELQLLSYILTKDSVFFDIGANLGAYTYVAERYANPKHIYAFEPIPALYKRLKKLFVKTNVYDWALSDTSGIAHFKIPMIQQKAVMSRASLNTNLVQDNESGYITIDVKTQILDTFVSESQLKRLDLIKIDVEGFEAHVIRGARQSIKQFKPILIVEIEQRHHTENIELIIEEIKSLGYNCYYLDPLDFSVKVAPYLQDLQNPVDLNTDRYINNFIFVSEKSSNYVNLLNRKMNQTKNVSTHS